MPWMLRSLLLFLACLGLIGGAHGAEPDVAQTHDILIISGTVTDVHGKGLKDARLLFYVNGEPVKSPAELFTEAGGNYEAELKFPVGTLGSARVEASVERRAYRPSGQVELPHLVAEHVDGDGDHHYLAHFSLNLARAISPAFWIATAVLLGVYIFIAFELLHRTLAAMVGASVLLFVSYTLGSFDDAYRVMTFDEAMRAIDNNVIFLLMAMMIIVGVLKRTGVFQWMAYKSFQWARGNIYMLSVLLMIVTAFVSAFLDNVTTMLLIIPVTIEIAHALKINPIALLMPEVFASNVGGTATLIGDPPNIMIGSYAGLSFTDFVAHLALVCVLGLMVTAVYFVFWYRKEYRTAKVADVPAMVVRLREEYRITDKAVGKIVPGADAHHPAVRVSRRAPYGTEHRRHGWRLAVAGD